MRGGFRQAKSYSIKKGFPFNNVLHFTLLKQAELFCDEDDVEIYLEHPIGTDYRSIVVHEAAGHSITLMISIKHGSLQAKDLCDKIQKDVLDCFNITQDQITDELSGSAKKSPFEFVVAGLAEFIDSKSPRRVAKKIGEIILAYLKELR